MTSTVADQVRLYVVRGTAGEISEGIRNLISAGVLAPGDALPPIRALADDLEVHRNTVAGAYRLLVAAGVVETQGRRGSFVRAIPFLEGEGGIALPGSVDLASGNPDPALLPDLRASLDRTTYTPRLYGAAATEPLLDSWARSSIEDEVLRPCSITITNGAVDAVERLLTAHLTRGDAVAIEDPCFLASIGTLKANSFRAVPMDIDTSGITRKGCCVLSKVVCARLFAPLVRTTPPGSA
ncbi:GntR family transcriptional regulator [Rhodococcus sp. 2.95]